MLEQGTYQSAVEIAEAENVAPSFVSRLLRLTLLAPDIQEVVLEGRQPKGDDGGRHDEEDAERVGGAASSPRPLWRS